MRYLILSPTGLGLFLVPHLGQSKDVEKVYFCVLSTEMKDLGKDMNKLGDWEKLEVVSDYAEVLNENKPSDLIVVIDDVGIGQTGKMIESQGYKVIGGKPITDRIEEDRQFATDLMKRVMDVPESVSFTSWERAIEFVKTNEPDDRLVFKPNDADVPKEYTYVSKNIADMVEAMQKFKSEWKWKEDFQIQRFIKGTEVDFSGYFNGKEFLKNSMMIYFENKPIMPGDIGPATGGSIAVEFARPVEGVFGDILNKLAPMLAKEGYKGQLAINSIVSDEDHKPYFLEFCYDEKTEILTRDGWKFFKDISENEIVMTLNPDTHIAEWQEIQRKVVKDYRGELVVIHNDNVNGNTINLHVTPDHDLYVGKNKGKKITWETMKAGKAYEFLEKGNELVFKRGGKWIGENHDFLQVPDYIEKHWLGKYKKSMDIIHRGRKIDADAFYSFIGLYLAEGNMDKYTVNIAQSLKSNVRDQIEEIFDKLGYEYGIDKEGTYRISSVAFSSFLSKFIDPKSKSYSKSIHHSLKEASPKLLKSLIYGLYLGDGSKKDGDIFTTSKKLADDIQEIAMKCGFVARIKERSAKGKEMTINGKTYKRKSNIFTVMIREEKVDTYVNKDWIRKEKYDSKVYCVTVPNHIIYVRREGVPVWSMNCGRFGYPSLPLDITLLEEQGHTVHQLFTALANSEQKTLFGTDKIAVTISVFVPPAPTGEMEIMEDTKGEPISWDPKWYRYFYPYYVMYDKRMVLAGISSWVLQITCADVTLDGALSMMYDTYVPTLKLQNAMYRNDCGVSAKKRIKAIKEAKLI